MKYRVKISKAPQQETEEMKYGGQQGFGLELNFATSSGSETPKL